MLVRLESTDGYTLAESELDIVPKQGVDVKFNGTPSRVLNVSFEIGDDHKQATVVLNKPKEAFR